MNTQTQPLSLIHLMRESNIPNAPSPLLILLHGVGGDEHGWDEILPQLDERYLVLSVRAPNEYANGGYCWFNVEFNDGKFSINTLQAEASWRALAKFVDEAAAGYRVAPEQVYLMGFSQGAAMAFCTMLTAPEKLGGIIALNGRVLPEVKPYAVAFERLENFPVLFVYGTYDKVIPVAFAREAHAYLATTGAALQAHEFPIAHEITADSLREVQVWLAQRFASR
jgi:phospholipase/carboxylesterase